MLVNKPQFYMSLIVDGGLSLNIKNKNNSFVLHNHKVLMK